MTISKIDNKIIPIVITDNINIFFLGDKKMRKFLLGTMALAALFLFAACDNGSGDGDEPAPPRKR